MTPSDSAVGGVVAVPVHRRGGWTGWHSVGLLASLLLIIAAGIMAVGEGRMWNWVLVLVVLAGSFAVIGQGTTRLWRGLLIDERNMLSLSRLQMVVWSVLILSAFLTAGLGNIAAGTLNPLSIAIPAELWLLMGISTASLVGSPLIKSVKRAKKPSMEEKLFSFELRRVEGADPDKMTAETVVVENTSPDQARWSDLFRGEEVGNHYQLDLGKVQMFYFTTILVIGYAVQLGYLFSSRDVEVAGFPGLDAGMVALLGISHAGYLAYKAAPHSEPSAK